MNLSTEKMVCYIELSDLKYYGFLHKKNKYSDVDLCQIIKKGDIQGLLNVRTSMQNYFATIIQRAFRNIEICAICQEMVQCGFASCHHFHNACINSWLMRGNTTCPVCRRPKLISYIKKRKIIEGALSKIQKLRKNIITFDANYFNDYEENRAWKRKIDLCKYFIDILSKYDKQCFIKIEYSSKNLDKLEMFMENLKTYIEDLQELIEDYYSSVHENSILNPLYVREVQNMLLDATMEY